MENYGYGENDRPWEEQLWLALKSTRQQATFIPIKDIAEDIKNVFQKEEIEQLIKYLI